MWLVKDILKNDFYGMFKLFVEMGFDGVEFVGDFGFYFDNFVVLKVKFFELGLVVSSVYIGFDVFIESIIDSILLFYKIFGVIIFYVFWDEWVWYFEGVKLLVKEFIKVSDYVICFNMKIGFYNYNKEFNVFNNVIFWDYIVSNIFKIMLL